MKVISTIICQDHCANLVFTKDKEYDEYYLEYFTCEFSNSQWRPKFTKWKMIWNILMGRRHRLFELCLSKEDIKKLHRELEQDLDEPKIWR